MSDLLYQKILYAQAGDLYLGTPDVGFVKVDASALTPNTAYHSGAIPSICFAGGYFWIVDGTNPLRRVNGVTGVIDQPAATGGSMPVKAQLLWHYRGRLFQGRFVASPYNYFASMSGDLLNYDSGDLTPVGAFAGNNTQQAGILGDILTAAIPYGDVSCVMGMANSIAIMRGDPKAGGSIDILSREIGIVSPTAWCRDPDGNLYFMARDGLYKLAAGIMGPAGQVQPMSHGRLSRTLGAIDFSTTRVAMEWDPQELGLKIYLIPATSADPTTSIFWEQRKNAFWIDSYAAGVGPTASVAVPGKGSDARVVLGCWDGVLRGLDPTAVDDDGAAISSLVRYAPKQFFGELVKAKITQSRFLWGPGDGDGANFHATYSFFTGDDPVTASAASADRSVTITTGGNQSTDRQRTRAANAILQIANSTLGKTWQIESAGVLVSPSGRVRS